MAGIGFVLKKLLRRDDLTGVVTAYMHGAFCSSGPWLLTCLALGIFYSITKFQGSGDLANNNFRSIVLYNFCFSLVLSAPFVIVTTRYLSDLIYKRQLRMAPGMLIGALFSLFVLGALIAYPFYFFFADLQPQVKIAAYVNFLLITGIWQASIFISALKQYTGVTLAFLSGLVISIVTAIFLMSIEPISGMLVGFNIGLSVILALLVALIFFEYPVATKSLFDFYHYFYKYWDLALGALLYTMAIWVDKWIMWTAPEAILLSNNLILYPFYDSAFFIATLTMVPAMALFLVNQETGFYEIYLKFYKDIQSFATLDKIQQNHVQMLRYLRLSARNLVFLQLSVTGMAVITAPRIITLLDMNYLQLGMLRFALLGVFFHVLTLFCIILLSYFDNRRETLYIQALFLVANFGFTILSKSLGFSWYGWGYFAGCLVTFVAAFLTVVRFCKKLPYHAFIANNEAIYEK